MLLISLFLRLAVKQATQGLDGLLSLNQSPWASRQTCNVRSPDTCDTQNLPRGIQYLQL